MIMTFITNCITNLMISFGITDATNLDVYNTQSSSWRKVQTKNPPESRYGHSAVLTNDGRIIVFGGSLTNNTFIPVTNQYVVLDTKTFEWYLGTGNVSARAPFRHHTATLYNNDMFIAFGVLDSGQTSNNILIYKIGDYANFSLEDSYTPYLANSDPTSSPLSTEPTISNNSAVIIKVFLGSTLGILTLGFVVFITFKWYKKTRIPEFEHVLNT